MTHTLNGRWQTRLLMNLTVGVLVSAIWGKLANDFLTAFALLGYMTALGLVWDLAYIRLQRLRWDHDWPPVLYLIAAGWELGILLAITQAADLPGISADYGWFLVALQYSTIGLLSFLLMFGPMRVLFPRWRFRGGQWF